jgi:hypothetical protein
VNFDPIFDAVEHVELSIWLRESLYAFPAVVTLHTIGMALLAGGSLTISLRLLGLANRVPISALTNFFPVLWFGFALNAATGILLLIAYPTKAFTNPIFYIKLLLLASALLLLVTIKHSILDKGNPLETAQSVRARRLARLSLASWAATIIAGRLLPYTYARLLVHVIG